MKKVLFSIMFGISLALISVFIIPASAHIGGVLTGFGTPTIDGVRSAGEWSAATEIPVFSGPQAGSTLLVMNDEDNLYIALDVVDPTLSGVDLIEYRFDNTHNGIPDMNDDASCLRDLNTVGDCHFELGSFANDITIHGAKATQNDGSNNFIEYSKPLSSGDVQDFNLSFGDTVGICVTYFPDGITSVNFGPNCRLTSQQQNQYGDILISSPPLVGGELIPLDTTALILAGAQMNAAWMIPVVLSVLGIGLFVVSRKSENS